MARSIPRGGGGQTLSPRDRSVVELVGRLRQVTAHQIQAVIFPSQASKTPLDRALKRLVEGKYLGRLGRIVGGEGGGSGQYVYQLGRAGWRLLGRTGTYRPARTVDVHTVGIAECFVALTVAAQADELTVISFIAEPASYRQVGSVLLTPDAYVEVGVRARGLMFSLWLEWDRATEHADTIQGKCVRYWRAYQAWEEDVFPYVLFVVPDESRAREIGRVVAGGPDEAQALFRVTTLNSLAEVIHRNL